jgi:hypothetical protein
MRACWIAAASTLATIASAVPAQACTVSVEVDLADVQYADVVVVGRIRNYETVLDPAAREERRRWLAESPDMPAGQRREYERQANFIGDHARFEIAVDEVLLGNAPDRITATWDNSMFGEPDATPSGPVLVALRDGSTSPPRHVLGTDLIDARRGLLTVLQVHCSGPFLFPSTSEQAGTVRRLVAERRTNPRPAQPDVR